MADDYHLSCGLLLDAFNKNTYGGTGEAFDWRLAKVALDLL
jgi:phosphoribosylanthranilate isomerase